MEKRNKEQINKINEIVERGIELVKKIYKETNNQEIKPLYHYFHGIQFYLNRMI